MVPFIFKIIKMKCLNLFIPVLFLIISCTTNNSKVALKNTENSKDEIVNQSSTNKNLCIVSLEEIKHRCFKNKVVIWVYPPKKKLDSIENSLSKDEVESFEQDMCAYNTDAQSYILDNAEKFMVSDSVRNYCFVIGNDTSFIKLEKFDKRRSLWNIILFDGKKSPKITTPVDLQRDYLKYFK